MKFERFRQFPQKSEEMVLRSSLSRSPGNIENQQPCDTFMAPLIFSLNFNLKRLNINVYPFSL